ncbi:MAG: hypothetical protein R3E96_16675 [Planctomycetota bacterium]
MSRSQSRASLILGLALAASVLGQGDDCSTATPISGTAPGRSTRPPTPLPDSPGVRATNNIYQDAFYQWIAPAAGTYQVDTTGFDLRHQDQPVPGPWLRGDLHRRR